MTSAIKPPGPGVPAADAAGTVERGAPAAPPGATPVGGSFRTTIDEVGGSREVRAAATAGASQGSPAAQGSSAAHPPWLASLVAEMKSGNVSPDQAVDRLVARAVSGGLAGGLTPERRAALEATLRATLTEDPTMIAMQRDLARAR